MGYPYSFPDNAVSRGKQLPDSVRVRHSFFPNDDTRGGIAVVHKAYPTRVWKFERLSLIVARFTTP